MIGVYRKYPAVNYVPLLEKDGARRSLRLPRRPGDDRGLSGARRARARRVGTVVRSAACPRSRPRAYGAVPDDHAQPARGSERAGTGRCRPALRVALQEARRPGDPRGADHREQARDSAPARTSASSRPRCTASPTCLREQANREHPLAIRALKKPVIAVVNGTRGRGRALPRTSPATPGSPPTSADCSRRRSSGVGLAPPSGATWLAGRLLGAGRAFEWLTHRPEPLRRPEALHWGLVWEVVVAGSS